MYKLGKWLRKRYENTILKKRYDAKDIYIRSSDEDRTLASASAVMAALYPPTDYQLWNPELLWQPIPIHTILKSTDYLIGPKVPFCPKWIELVKALEVAPELLQMNRTYEKFFEYVLENAGYTYNTSIIANIESVAKVRDALYIQDLYGKKYIFIKRIIFGEMKM